VYVTNTSANNVSQLAIGSHGSLSSLTPPSIEAGSSPSGVAVSPDGSSVYVSNGGEPTISQYDINAATGALSAKSPATVPSGGSFIHQGIVVTPDGKSVYVTNCDENSVSQYDVNPPFGTLGSKALPALATGKCPLGVAVTPNGKSAYVANEQSDTVSQYDINATSGELTPKSPEAAVPAVLAVSSVAVAPNGKSAYASGAGGISQYDINPATGALSAKSPASVSGPLSGGTDFSTQIVVTPNGKSVYASDGVAYKPEVFQYDVNKLTGSLTHKTPESVSTEAQPSNLALKPDGKFLYVTITFGEKSKSITEKVLTFAINRKTGALSPQNSLTTTGGPIGIAVGPLPHKRKKHH
jgi:6-phosphogluconolactonase (cycloisomerase 2 family)